jgi:hypothetical protein
LGSALRIVVDHISGSRRGQRQEFDLVERVRFGRHPDNEVSFDAHRDLDASSRHAELRRSDPGYQLRDVGSSNGTFVAAARVTEVEVGVDEPVEIEFGQGGPRVRVFVGSDTSIAALPKIRPEPAQAPSRWIVAAAVALLIALVTVAIWWRITG